MPVRPEDVEELARTLWERFQGKRVTLDRRGKPNYFVVMHLARRLLEICDEVGIEDPLHEIDFTAVLDPDLEPAENLRLFTSWVTSKYGRKAEVVDEVDRAITELEKEVKYLEGELERAPPEVRADIEEELRRVRTELERLRRVKRPTERRVRPPKPKPRVVRPPPPKPHTIPTPPPKPPTPPLPTEEVRSRIESYIRSKVPRTYRFDWRDLRARISYHRDVESELMRVVGELGGEVVGVGAVRPPMKVVDVDFSKAKVPPPAFPPEFERALLWGKFSAILTAVGLSPEEYASDFEALLERLRDRPLEVKQKEVEALAKSIAAPYVRPPAPPVPVEEIRRIVREEVREALRVAPPTPEAVKAYAEVLTLTPIVLVPSVDPKGHPFWGPSVECLGIIRRVVLERWYQLYFQYCPECRKGLPGGGLRPTEFVEHIISWGAVIPMFTDWLRRYARTLEEHEGRRPL